MNSHVCKVEVTRCVITSEAGCKQGRLSELLQARPRKQTNKQTKIALSQTNQRAVSSYSAPKVEDKRRIPIKMLFPVV